MVIQKQLSKLSLDSSKATVKAVVEKGVKSVKTEVIQRQLSLKSSKTSILK